MDKKPIVIIFICLLLGLGICLALWIFVVLMPFLERVQAMEDLGITYGGTISDILELLFLNPYFICMIVFGILTLIFRIIGWKSLKSN